ncbi:DUF805 domain-containing protein [Novosphingopyxis baekryungensis]|uniref:DUF805 domain-containing protein n=1 Tax=Novosphingopyxis baekryungensis TaxID=279369 RepID=UPI0003B6E20A|nr:DUF805 domain-containing protein [Novosphingopyxis baekryungensis]
MEWMILPFKRYADFRGRSRRKEYWMFTLFIAIATVLLGAMMVVSAEGLGTAFGLVALLGGLVIIIPSLAVQVRRFHDQDKSGWFVLLNLIPYIGGFIVLIMMLLPGTAGKNRYGPDPKALGEDALTETFR